MSMVPASQAPRSSGLTSAIFGTLAYKLSRTEEMIREEVAGLELVENYLSAQSMQLIDGAVVINATVEALPDSAFKAKAQAALNKHMDRLAR